MKGRYTNINIKLDKFKVILLIILISFGIEFEFKVLESNELIGEHLTTVLISILMLLLYILPAMLIIKYIAEIWKVKKYIIFISLFIGLFSTGFIPAYINDYVSDAFVNNQMIDWIEALSAGIIEEILKLSIALLIFSIINIKNIKVAVIIGLSVGLGFQITEDISYILSAENQGDLIYQSLSRLAGSFTSHWIYTGILTASIVGLVLKKTEKNNRIYLLYVSSPFILHILWNSPLNINIWTSTCLTSLTLIIALSIYSSIDKNKKVFRNV